MPRRPLLGMDLRIGALLALALGVKFAPPMLSAKVTRPMVAPTLVAVNDPSRPPTDALTNTLPTSVKQPAAGLDEPPVLSAPVFAFDEKKSPPAKADPILPEPSKDMAKSDPFDPPKPPAKLDLGATKAAEAPRKPVKLRPVEMLQDDPPIVLADSQKSATEPEKELVPKPEKVGPVHPYFQRYLDQKEYFVRPGDTLELIAHRLYQDEKKAAELLAANKDVLPSPAALKPGMTIKLP